MVPLSWKVSEVKQLAPFFGTNLRVTFSGQTLEVAAVARTSFDSGALSALPSYHKLALTSPRLTRSLTASFLFSFFRLPSFPQRNDPPDLPRQALGITNLSP